VVDGGQITDLALSASHRDSFGPYAAYYRTIDPWARSMLGAPRDVALLARRSFRPTRRTGR
jgi:hypothetical protein